MSSIYADAVRALWPVFGERGEDGYPLAYCCAPPCPHQSCAAVRAIDEDGLLWRRPPLCPHDYVAGPDGGCDPDFHRRSTT